MRSRASLELLRRPEPQEEIARMVGVTQQAVQQWGAGLTKPTRAKRDVLQSLYGIEPPWWDEPPPSPPVPDPNPNAPATEQPDVSTFAARLALQVDRSIREIESEPMTPGERARLLDRLANIVKRLRDDELAPAQIAKSATWKRLIDALAVGLKPIPGALEAAAAVLERFAQGEEQ